MRFKSIIPAFFLLLYVNCAIGQSFEGSITLRIWNDQLDRISKVTVKNNKTLMETDIDSVESIKIITDYGAESTTLLRNKSGLKYGFKMYTIESSRIDPDATNNTKNNITSVFTDDVKWIGKIQCTKIQLENKHVIAEAWVAKNIPTSLSNYFPEFIGKDMDPQMYELRLEAEKAGFVVTYWEKQRDTNAEINFEATIQQEEISGEVYNVDNEYFVLDADSMKRLYVESQSSELKKKQWEEFMLLFSKNH